jgi:uncharacterized protein (DUF305 family)
MVVGYLIWGTKARGPEMHMMPDGTMMHDEEMSMDAMMHDMMAELDGKTGDEFDKAFLSEMIVHHEGAVDMAEAALTDAKHQELKDMAKAIITAQTTEIAQMKTWLKTWYGE